MANPTTNLNITLPEPGSESSRGTWGTTINEAIQSLDTVIADRSIPSGGTDNQMLTKNGTTDYSTQWTSAVTATTITATGATTLDGDVTVSDGTNDLNIASHDGTNGLKLGGVLVEATAAELNILAGETDIATQSEVDARVGAAITAAQGLGTGNSVSFVNVNSDVTGDLTGDVTGNADTATALETARTIGGVSFNGTANINLPGVNAAGNQNTTGNSATTTALATARNIGGVSFDGTANIDLPGVNASGTQDTSGNADTVTTNANLTGHVTSSGNATTLGSFTVAQLSSALSDASISGNNTGDLTNGIANTNNVVIDDSSVAASQFAKFTSSGLEGRTATELKTDLLLNNVANIDISAYSGSSILTTVGTIGTGTWQGTPVAQAYIADQAVNEAKMQISNAPTNGHVLTARSGTPGGMTWEAAGGSFEPAGNSIAMAIALGIVLIPLLG